MLVSSHRLVRCNGVNFVDPQGTRLQAIGNRQLATGYINYLYSPLGQELAAKYNFRPRDAKAAKKYASKFPKIQTFDINTVFGGWAKAQQTHFVNGAIFDQLYNDRK